MVALKFGKFAFVNIYRPSNIVRPKILAYPNLNSSISESSYVVTLELGYHVGITIACAINLEIICHI